MEDRFREIFQRRHDCIHNCDRPRVKPQPLTAADVVRRVLEDVEFLVCRCDEHINGSSGSSCSARGARRRSWGRWGIE